MVKEAGISQLSALVHGKHLGRALEDQINLFDGTGVGMQDLAVSTAFIDLAFERGAATEVDL